MVKYGTSSQRPPKPEDAVSERMRRVRQKDTGPEMTVRRLLTRLGFRYRVCSPTLPGRPDLANKAKGWCVFVHGCFWHGHDGCPRSRLPKTNRRYWHDKIQANKARDDAARQQLENMGLRVLIVWECELDDRARMEHRLWEFVSKRPVHSEADQDDAIS